ncbi:hypothetical protein GGX14DRAFT_403467 [Mycena pura]|uniref:Uncharacterized protein n=1 Tax=Mycena pura TaxID=153505 RepID=A0AAD6Y4I9_9AGAR|nr:hypothetical protein GGX14DRAFT_403467 [Mycena pura]
MPVWGNGRNDGQRRGGSVTWGRQRDRSAAHSQWLGAAKFLPPQAPVGASLAALAPLSPCPVQFVRRRRLVASFNEFVRTPEAAEARSSSQTSTSTSRALQKDNIGMSSPYIGAIAFPRLLQRHQ